MFLSARPEGKRATMQLDPFSLSAPFFLRTLWAAPKTPCLLPTLNLADGPPPPEANTLTYNSQADTFACCRHP